LAAKWCVFSGKCKKKSEKKKKKLRRKEQSKNGTLDKMLIKLYNIVICINFEKIGILKSELDQELKSEVKLPFKPYLERI